MPQTTDAVAMSCSKLEFAPDCAAFQDISGESQSVSGTEQSLLSGEAFTFSGATAIIKGGKREPMEIEVVIVYTETDAEAYEQIRAVFEATDCPSNVCIRWSPAGGNAGDEQVTTQSGVITGFTYPPIDASTAGPILAGFTIKVPGVDTTIVSS